MPCLMTSVHGETTSVSCELECPPVVRTLSRWNDLPVRPPRPFFEAPRLRRAPNAVASAAANARRLGTLHRCTVGVDRQRFRCGC